MRLVRGLDRFGLGWRPELAASLFAHRGALDLVEAVVEMIPTAQLRSYATLAVQLPLWLHGTTLGLASTFPVDEVRLRNLARTVDRIGPEGWSEHMAFVRVPGVEIGHLAAPPRTPETVEGAARNLRRAAAVVGSLPLLENVACLTPPLGSTLGEGAWITALLEASGAALLLDLHNLYTNAMNEGDDPVQRLLSFPLSRVRQVHIAGGRWIGPPNAPRRLDDHLHPVPVEVFALLETLAQHCPQPLTVVLERDGRYPPLDALLMEVAQAREVVARGRQAGMAPAS